MARFQVRGPSSGHFLETIEAESAEGAIRIAAEKGLDGPYEPEHIDHGLAEALPIGECGHPQRPWLSKCEICGSAPVPEIKPYQIWQRKNQGYLPSTGIVIVEVNGNRAVEDTFDGLMPVGHPRRMYLDEIRRHFEYERDILPSWPR